LDSGISFICIGFSIFSLLTLPLHNLILIFTIYSPPTLSYVNIILYCSMLLQCVDWLFFHFSRLSATSVHLPFFCLSCVLKGTAIRHYYRNGLVLFFVCVGVL
jgi:hypothetical protein